MFCSVRQCRRYLGSISLFSVVTLVGGVTVVLPSSRPLFAAEEVPPLVERVEVEVVDVDVVVTDKQGRVVTDLRPEDFLLLEEGEERPISNFYSFENGQVSRARGTAKGDTEQHQQIPWPDRTLRRRMAILFDLNSLERGEVKEIVDSFEQFILEQFDGSYEWAVIAYDSRVRLLRPFSSDKSTVIGALGEVRDLPIPTRRQHASDPAFTEHPVVVSRTQALGRQQAIDQSGPLQLTAEDFEIRERMMQALKSFELTASAAIQTMRAYAALPGRKSLVLVTGTLETLPSGPLLLGQGLPGIGGGERADPLIQTLNSDLERLYVGIIQMANGASFTIYPMSPAVGLDIQSPYLDVGREATISFTQAGSSRLPSVSDTSTTQNVLASGTGGVFYSSSNLYKSLDNVDERTANSYVLGFLTDHRPDRKYHDISVRVRKPGLKVRHREGYLHLSRRDRLVEELATPLYFPKAHGDFAVEVQVQPPDKASKKKVDLTVAAVVPFDVVSLVPEGNDLVGRVFMFLAIYDHDGNLHQLVRQYQDLRLPAERVAAFPEGAPARFAIQVKDLPRDDYTFTLTVMDEISDRYGTGLQPLQL